MSSADATNGPPQVKEALENENNQPGQSLPLSRTTKDNQHEDATAQAKEDPATVAASEELRHTSISERIADSSKDATASSGSDIVVGDKEMEEHATGKARTPEPAEITDAHDETMRERLSSPKKKRGRDQDEDIKELDSENLDEPGSSDGSVINGGRSTRSGPEKKRPRDGSEDRTAEVAEASIPTTGADSTIKPEDTEQSKKDPESLDKAPASQQDHIPQTSASAFANSGFASLASAASPFGSIGASKPSVFGAAGATSGFGALAGSKPSQPPSTATTSGFGALSGDKSTSGFGFGGPATSSFGGLRTQSVFGSALGNGFAGGAGQKLSTFAAPGTAPDAIKGSKPVKAFGAPESDAEDGTDEDDSDGPAGTDDEDAGPHASEDKKKSKFIKVPVEDGESGEATLLQIRAKLFAIDSNDPGWKERGVGTLKINVPKSAVDYDEGGLPIPGSFDISGLESEEDENAPRVVRLIMRQENTHRVVLNSVVVPAMEFQDKPATSAAQILFTAFEGDKDPKPINMLLKMSEANARLFRAEIQSIKRELQSQ